MTLFKLGNDEQEIREGVGKLTIKEMQDELVMWRSSASNMAILIVELNKFKRFAGSGEELASRINQMTSTYKATIELRDREIDELKRQFIQLRMDPLGIDLHFKDQPKANTKH